MTVQALHALQNGFLGLQRSALFYGEYSEEESRFPSPATWCGPRRPWCSSTPGCHPAPCLACSATTPWRASATPISSSIASTPSGSGRTTWTSSSSRTCTTTTPGAELFAKSELLVQRDEYAAAQYPSPFFASFYYRKNFDLPGYRWRLLDGDTELAPGLTVLRSDGHTPGHQSLLVELPQTGPVILSGDACYWQEHVDAERVPGVVWNPAAALHSIKRLKTLARLVGGRIFPAHDPVFWRTVKQSPAAYR